MIRKRNNSDESQNLLNVLQREKKKLLHKCVIDDDFNFALCIFIYEKSIKK